MEEIITVTLLLLMMPVLVLHAAIPLIRTIVPIYKMGRSGTATLVLRFILRLIVTFILLAEILIHSGMLESRGIALDVPVALWGGYTLVVIYGWIVHPANIRGL